MKIVNMKKFLRMTLIVFVIIVGISLYFSNVSFSKGDIKTKTVNVTKGDTLWSIAREEQENNAYYENKDIRDIIYEIKQLNKLDNNSNLKIGQKLIIKSL